jgi:hypothetical protein
MIAAVPYGFACYFVQREWTSHNLPVFFLQILVILPVYLVGIGLVFRKELGMHVRGRVQDLAFGEVNTQRQWFSRSTWTSLSDESAGD